MHILDVRELDEFDGLLGHIPGPASFCNRLGTRRWPNLAGGMLQWWDQNLAVVGAAIDAAGSTVDEQLSWRPMPGALLELYRVIRPNT